MYGAKVLSFSSIINYFLISNSLLAQLIQPKLLTFAILYRRYSCTRES